jgi:hypothetical protein
MLVRFFTRSKPKQKIARSTAATRIEYSIENQYVHVARMVGKLLSCGHWMLKPGNYVEIQLQPVLLDRISSHPSLTLYWPSYSTLHCCLNTYVEQKFLNCNVKASNVIWSVDWACQEKKTVCSSLGRFPKLRKQIERFEFYKGFVRLYTHITKEGSFPSVRMLVRAS